MQGKNQFTSSQVTKKLDISLRQLYYWELKGVVRPEVITMGSREFKRYSRKDFEILKKVKDYIDEGYTLSGAIRKVRKIEELD